MRYLTACAAGLLMVGVAAALLPPRAPAAETIPPLHVTREAADPAAGAGELAAWSQAQWRADVDRWGSALVDNKRRADAASARTRAARSARTRSRTAAGILACENPSGSYTAENPTSSASGRYQFVDGTFRGTRAARAGGWTHAADAPPEVQDAAFAEVWDGGRGSHHWRECGG